MVGMETEHIPASRTDRSLVIIGGAIAALVVVAALVVILVGSRDSTAFAADSPEGVVQAYLAAYEEGDFAAAHAFFSSAARQELPIEEYERAARGYGGPGRSVDGSSQRILFDQTTGEGDHVTVRLTVEEFYDGGGPFGGGDTYRSSREVGLVREAGMWRIDQPLLWLDPAPVMDF